MKYLLSALLLLCPIASLMPETSLAASTQCNSVLSQSKARLPNLKGFKVINISKFLGQPPQGRSKHLTISIDGSAGDKYMNQHNAQLVITKKIVASCPQIAIVSFNKYQTDWVNMYGLVNGKVQAFTCKDVDEKINWGEYTCL